MTKGLIYTSFALLAIGLLVSLTLLPLQTPDRSDPSEAIRIGQASFFLDSVLRDMERSLSLATRRALTASTNYVVENGTALADYNSNVSSALINGTISGYELDSMENVSMQEWTGKVAGIANDSGYRLNASVESYSLGVSEFEVESSFGARAVLKDPVTLARFNRTRRENATVSAAGLEDTMLLLRSKGRYVSQYSSCPYDVPVERVASTSDHSDGYAYGNASVKPADAGSVSNPSQKILVVEDVDNHDTSDVNSFAGVASEQPNSSGGYTTVYAFDTGSLDGLVQNRSALVDQGDVWRMDLSTTFDRKCYYPSPTGPDAMERLENRLVSETGGGVETLIDVAELPSELRVERSAVAHVYFNETDEYGDHEKIKGVSDEYGWFRLDREHVDRWGMASTVK